MVVKNGRTDLDWGYARRYLLSWLTGGYQPGAVGNRQAPQEPRTDLRLRGRGARAGHHVRVLEQPGAPVVWRNGPWAVRREGEARRGLVRNEVRRHLRGLRPSPHHSLMRTIRTHETCAGE